MQGKPRLNRTLEAVIFRVYVKKKIKKKKKRKSVLERGKER